MSHVMNYIECDAPPELTLAEWRRARAATAPRPRRGWRRPFGAARRRRLPAA